VGPLRLVVPPTWALALLFCHRTRDPHLYRPRGIFGAKPPAGAARAAGSMLHAARSARREDAAIFFTRCFGYSKQQKVKSR
jgi:hypothetical protein